MGLIVNKNKQNNFQLISTVSDERLHDEEWITREEAIKILVEKQAWRFIERVVEVYLDFPLGYANGELEIHRAERKFHDWWNKQKFDHEKLHQKFQKIIKEIDFSFDLDDQKEEVDNQVVCEVCKGEIYSSLSCTHCGETFKDSVAAQGHRCLLNRNNLIL